MPAQENRKIMKFSSSGVVAIPTAYRRYHELGPGDEVVLLYDSLLLLVPKKLMDIAAEKHELIAKLLGG